MTTAYLFDQRLQLHDDWQHPENASRLRAIGAALDSSGLAAELQRLEMREAPLDDVLAVHSRRMVEHTQRMAMFGGGQLNLDTYVVQESWEAALLAAGAVTRGVEAVLGGEVGNAFALVRPPGHHATPGTAMGFCLLNNVAIAARAAQARYGAERIAIIDWDTHHGNGTQDVFYEDASVLYVSSHTYPFYPFTGHWREMGAGQGSGTTLNLPLPQYAGDRAFELVYNEVVARAVRRFEPDLLLVSAGYDSHWRDPLAPMTVSVAGYARLAQRICDLADEVCDGRLVLALEGGYDAEALAASVLATFRVLQGRPELAEDPLGTVDEPALDLAPVVENLLRAHPLLT